MEPKSDEAKTAEQDPEQRLLHPSPVNSLSLNPYSTSQALINC